MLYSALTALRLTLEESRGPTTVAPNDAGLGSPDRLAGAGAAVRSVLEFISRFPLTSLTGDTVSRIHSVDLLRDRLDDGGNDPLTLVQLAEAMTFARHDLGIVRVARGVIDPMSFVTGTALRQSARLGKASSMSAEQRLLRRVHRIVSSRREPQATDLLAMCRMYRLAGKPGIATHIGYEAIRSAGMQRDACTPRSVRERFRAALGTDTDEKLTSLLGAPLGRARAAAIGDLAGLSQYERASIVLGAAWTATGWASRDLRDRPSAERCVRGALDVGFSHVVELHGALLDASNPAVALWDRCRMIGTDTVTHRRFYKGAWRGAKRTAGVVTAHQVGKIVDLVTPDSEGSRNDRTRA